MAHDYLLLIQGVNYDGLIHKKQKPKDSQDQIEREDSAIQQLQKIFSNLITK